MTKTTNEIQRQGMAWWSGAIGWVARRVRGRYVQLLEEDIARLRGENRALVNSLLGTAGFPPVELDEAVRRGSTAMSPVRRRTWTQIARDRESAAGRLGANK